MAAQLTSQFLGTQLQRVQQRQAATTGHRQATCMAVRKVNTLDPDWKKTPVGIGLFAEDSEKPAVNIFKRVEQKKLLSSVEKLGLLSKAEKAGFSLSKIEKMGLLSTAERLGLLSLADELLVTDPGKVTSASIPFFVVAVLALVAIPHDNLAETLLSYTVSVAAGGVFTALFIGGFVLKSLQDE